MNGIPFSLSASADMLVYIIIAFAVGFVLSFLITWLIARGRSIKLREHLRFCEEQLEGLAKLQDTNGQLRMQLARLDEARRADAEKLSWVEESKARMEHTFTALASQALQVNADVFAQRANEQLDNVVKQLKGDWNTQKAQMQTLVDPLQMNLNALDNHVRALEEKREGAYKGLEAQLRQLMTTHGEFQQTTTRLAQALKSSSVRGRWGELQLRRIVEMAGLVEHVDFEEQMGMGNGRPDMVVNLPNGGLLPVDAKTPMQAYIEAIESSSDGARLQKIKEHVNAVKGRIRELNQRDYWQQFTQTPEFVIMFIPNEACIYAAFEHDATLLEYAIEHRVLIVSPVTLLALLKAVVHGWQQYQLSENTRQIIDETKDLRNRVGKFVEHFANVGRHLEKTVSAFNSSVGSFEGRLLPSITRLQDLGVVGQELASPRRMEQNVRLLSSYSAGGEATPNM